MELKDQLFTADDYQGTVSYTIAGACHNVM